MLVDSKLDNTIFVKEVRKYYGDAAALDNVSLTIPDGRFMTLLGPSGSGKTTLLMAIAGFTKPDSGNVLLGERNITSLPPEARNFGMVFQGYALFPHLSVAENVAFSLRMRKVGRADMEKRVRSVLDMVQLSHLADRFPRALSGGQQQRVALARALVFEPRVLLLDEPLSALDRRLRADLQWELKELHSRLELTFLYVTHDQEEALSMSDEIAIVRNGRIVQHGEPRALYENPATHFVAGFLGKSNYIEGRFLMRDGVAHLRTQDIEIAVGDNLHAVAGSDIVVSVRPERITLSDRPPETENNVLPGRLIEWSYQGATMACRVQTSLGAFQVQIMTWRSQLHLSRDLPVWLEWEPSAATLVADDR